MPRHIGDDGSSAGGSSMAPEECAAVKSNARTNMRPAKTRTAATGAGTREGAICSDCWVRCLRGGSLLRVVAVGFSVVSFIFSLLVVVACMSLTSVEGGSVFS